MGSVCGWARTEGGDLIPGDGGSAAQCGGVGSVVWVQPGARGQSQRTDWGPAPGGGGARRSATSEETEWRTEQGVERRGGRADSID